MQEAWPAFHRVPGTHLVVDVEQGGKKNNGGRTAAWTSKSIGVGRGFGERLFKRVFDRGVVKTCRTPGCLLRCVNSKPVRQPWKPPYLFHAGRDMTPDDTHPSPIGNERTRQNSSSPTGPGQNHLITPADLAPAGRRAAGSLKPTVSSSKSSRMFSSRDTRSKDS